ncbi:DsbA family oxidoreductase [Saccharothrix deserti]|uniref:DsbA family oxidoreductase n=1 Tax=Saccharothrix deserti TaxID=2593674 RepID=UPI00131E1084|nr:DsbA family oxidoreductase [Saccharothrix deserti]
MRVEIWSDIICPWCGLGNHRLGRALERFEHGGDVEVVHRSFPLDPTLPSGPAMTARQMLKNKYGMDDSQVDAATGRVRELAERDGLTPYVVADNTVGNTALAHEFLAYATDQGKHAEAWHLMFRAYFGDVRSIFTVDALLEVAAELGLDQDETREVLRDRRFRQQVEDETRQAQELGARGVPFIVIDGKYAISGAQDTGALLGALRQVWDESHPKFLVEDAEGLCGPDGCAVPDTHPAHA